VTLFRVVNARLSLGFGFFRVPDFVLVLTYGSQVMLGVRAGTQSCRPVAWRTVGLEGNLSWTDMGNHDAVSSSEPLHK
jgi:hypothetical protein